MICLNWDIVAEKHLGVLGSGGKLVNEMYEIFADVLQVPRDGQVDEKVASREIIGHLQELLGVQHLLRLRTEAIQAAIIALERTAQP